MTAPARRSFADRIPSEVLAYIRRHEHDTGLGIGAIAQITDLAELRLLAQVLRLGLAAESEMHDHLAEVRDNPEFCPPCARFLASAGTAPGVACSDYQTWRRDARAAWEIS